MADIRDLSLLVSLARTQHFSRAAEVSGISQPAFSARIRKLEEEFSLPLVRRGNKFMGFTREGEVVLKWARKLLGDMEGMQQEIDMLSNTLSGKLSLGVIPTALPFAAQVSSRLRQRYPDLLIEIHSLATHQIEMRLNDFSLDAGFIYYQDADPEITEKLYDETYVLIAPEALAPRRAGQTTWAEAGGLPLCLLTSDMRNRQLLDRVFASIDRVPTIVMQASDFTAVLAQVADGAAATIVPESVADTFLDLQATVRLELVEPCVRNAIGLSIKDQTPVLPKVRALRFAVREAS